MSPVRKIKVGLSREAIAIAALALIDRHGLGGFSTRKLGTALDCEAMAIYWYYPSKDALLDAVVDRLIAPIAELLSDSPSRPEFVDTLRSVAHAYRAIATEHPHAFPLLATRRFATEASYAFLDTLFARARAAGVSDRAAARCYRAVSSYVNGFALSQIASSSLDKPTRDRRARLDRAFPRVAAINAHLDEARLDAMFEAGLEVFLEAL
ncbi:MAG: TetR/AcrR family transcriptional regulator [Deltaproteobacteria bacterium]|nr:TetR/AcrR family transcriptional regulator [Deltaproteobacteria bacterium]